nr:MAG TPA: hypothetical protein [Caudoviricetes sp.]
MAYLVLRNYLQRHFIPLRVVAVEIKRNINEVYDMTGKWGTAKFTEEEMDTIWNVFLKDCTKTKEEIFKYEIFDPFED